ncbi:MAG: lysophospholipid acyltransferase family protein [Aeoliella sp.]
MATAYRSFTLLQWCFYYFNQFLVRVVWRATVPKQFPLGPGKGAVVICNHRSSIDPCIVQVAARRRLVHWLVAQLYPPKSLIGRMLALFETIPVRREGNDVSPLKAAFRMAEEGHLVGMLPEGTINTTDEFMMPVRPGAVVVALRSRVPVLPCYLEGVPYHKILWRPVFMPARVKLVIGDPIDLSEYWGRERDAELIARLTLECVQEIAKLAGREDFQPQIAGREWKTWK